MKKNSIISELSAMEKRLLELSETDCVSDEEARWIRLVAKNIEMLNEMLLD